MCKSVILYEDEHELRMHLENVFSLLHDEFVLLGAFPDADEVLAHLKTYAPDMVLMDIQLKGDEDGLVALYKIKTASSGTRVMMLTTFDEDDKVLNAISLGADGYMLKTDFSSYLEPHEALQKSLNTILDGGAYLTPTVAKKILDLFQNPTISDRIANIKARFSGILSIKSSGSQKLYSLTRKQKIVLQKIAEGKPTSEIARELQLSENTVNTHIKAIYSVLAVHSRVSAIKKAIENKLVKF